MKGQKTTAQYEAMISTLEKVNARLRGELGDEARGGGNVDPSVMVALAKALKGSGKLAKALARAQVQAQAVRMALSITPTTATTAEAPKA